MSTETTSPERSVGDRQPATVRPALRLLGGDAVVCEGDSCLVLPSEPAQD
ncbi:MULTISPECIES: hypothetical protein [unclassified Plantibacter]|nr:MULTISPECIES: hypothetical protein [unclassified Plantibacter]